VQLGGALGRARGWGVALAVEIEDGMGKHRSRLGNDLCERACNQGLASIGVVVYREDGMPDADTVKLSLRGAGDETDTTPVSEAFGGGGHRLASSCIVRREEFEGWAVKEE
jgi:nanoRNase/pAp phosphatase (c-di-AMP/oligoRNAs hydrolase)